MRMTETISRFFLAALLLGSAALLAGGTALADSVSVSDGKIRFKSNDGNFTMAVGGSIHADYAYYSEETNAEGNEVTLGNGGEIRRGRLAVSGTVWEDWKFKAQYDIASSSQIKDVWIAYAGLKPVTIQFGHFKPYFTMEDLTSSNDTFFMERAMLVQAFAQGRQMGVGVKAGGGFWSAGASFHFPNDGEDSGRDTDDTLDFSARATLAPIVERDMAVHLGAYVSYRDYQDDDGAGGKDERFHARPESDVTETSLVSTSSFTNPDDALLYGFELAGLWGPVMGRAEYTLAEFATYAYDPSAQVNGDEVASADYKFSGLAVEASGMLTPGDRRSYSAKRGVFGGVEPRKNFLEDGGIGALELAVRYSLLDLEDAGQGAKESNISVGLNWYPNSTMRFMVNYVQALEVKGGEHDGVEPSIFQVRGQIAF